MELLVDYEKNFVSIHFLKQLFSAILKKNIMLSQYTLSIFTSPSSFQLLFFRSKLFPEDCLFSLLWGNKSTGLCFLSGQKFKNAFLKADSLGEKIKSLAAMGKIKMFLIRMINILI